MPCLTFRLISAFSGLTGVEIIELVQAQQAEFPQIIAEHVAFAEQQFAADDFVARAGVAAELDAPHKKLLLLVEGEGQIDRLGVVMHIGVRHRREVDEPVVSVELCVIFDRFADFRDAENFALLDRENRFQKIRLEEEPLVGICVAHVKRSHVVARAFLDRNRDVGGLAFLRAHQRNVARKNLRVTVTFSMIGSFTSTLKYPLS